MSKQKKQKLDAKAEVAPIPEPLSVDYAPTGRAACKKCHSSIPEGSVRVGRMVRSRFHDGFDTLLYHWRCGSDYGTSLDEFKGWQSKLRWGGPNDDVERLINSMGDEWVEDKALIEEYQKRNQYVHTASEHLSDVPAGLLRQVFEANDMVFSDRAKGSDLAAVIADCVLYGKLPACPTCNTNGLRQAGTDIRCSGWFSASTKCDFKFRIVNLLKNRPNEFGSVKVGDELMMSRLSRCGRVTIPEDVGAHRAFKTLIIAKELQVNLKKLAGSSGKGATGGGLATSVMATLDSEDEDLEGSEPKTWLLGTRFVLCGLSHSDQETLGNKIILHGGSVQEDVVVAGPDRTTHLVISEEELFRDPKSSKYRRCNEAGIPIVKENFIEAVTDHEAVQNFLKERVEAGSATDRVVEVSGRSKKAPNAIINGKYVLEEGTSASDRPVFKKSKDSKCPDLYLFYSGSRQKWKIAPSLDDGKGHVAINNDAKAERPHLCSPGNWEVFDGKEKGFKVDEDVVVEKRGVGKRTRASTVGGPAGPLLRQRKYLKAFIVEGSVGKKLPRIQDVLIAQSGQALSRTGGGKKRPSPIPGSPLLTIDEEAADQFPHAQILVDAYNNVYNVLLTKTDASTNQNKFYAVQLLTYKSKKGSGAYQYAVFRKWGRFGASAGPMNGSLAVPFGPSKNEAIDAFKEKFTECTGLEFEVRDVAPQKPGRYMYVELAGQHEGGNAVESSKKMKAKKSSLSCSATESLLPKEIADLIDLIFDLEMIEREMTRSMDIDTSRLPPNALSRRQLANGLAVLRELERFLNPIADEEGGKENQAIDGPTRELRLKDCSNRFYSIVPHSFDRKEAVAVIDNIKLLRRRIRTIEDLMQIVELEEMRVSSAASAITLDRPLADVQYEELGCKLDIVKKDAIEWELINKAIQDTHASTHTTYTLSIDKIFRVERPGEHDRFLADPCQTNKRMLWHGSRLSNWASILKNGLRIAPKEAPVTGYMFGKGVYFADSSSKSANYCFANKEEPDGLLVLCDIALGNQYKRLEAQYEAPSKCRRKGCDSTWGVGENAPLESVTFPDGSVVSCGKLAENTEALAVAKQEQPRGKPSLLYNEFIVYRETQVSMKYIVHVKFKFAS